MNIYDRSNLSRVNASLGIIYNFVYVRRYREDKHLVSFYPLRRRVMAPPENLGPPSSVTRFRGACLRLDLLLICRESSTTDSVQAHPLRALDRLMYRVSNGAVYSLCVPSVGVPSGGVNKNGGSPLRPSTRSISPFTRVVVSTTCITSRGSLFSTFSGSFLRSAL